MYVKNEDKNTVLATNATLARGFARFRGLLGTNSLPEGSGIILEQTRQVHMFFMRYAIDVAFVNRANTVTRCVHELRPWTVSPLVRSATYAIELPAGTLAATATEAGDQLQLYTP